MIPLKTLLAFALALVAGIFNPAGAASDDDWSYYPDNYLTDETESLDPEYDPRYPYYPRMYSDSADREHWHVYIFAAEQDPPNSVIVYVYNDTPDLVYKTFIDLRVQIGEWDANRNFMVEQTRILDGVEIDKGMNRIPVNVHNYKAQIVIAKLLRSWSKSPIELY